MNRLPRKSMLRLDPCLSRVGTKSPPELIFKRWRYNKAENSNYVLYLRPKMIMSLSSRHQLLISHNSISLRGSISPDALLAYSVLMKHRVLYSSHILSDRLVEFQNVRDTTILSSSRSSDDLFGNAQND